MGGKMVCMGAYVRNARKEYIRRENEGYVHGERDAQVSKRVHVPHVLMMFG